MGLLLQSLELWLPRGFEVVTSVAPAPSAVASKRVSEVGAEASTASPSTEFGVESSPFDEFEVEVGASPWVEATIEFSRY